MALSLLLLTTHALAAFRPGDVILQPLNCYSCGLIEAQENSSFSHMGLIVQVEPDVLVAEALGRVRVVSLQDFLAKGDRRRAHKLMRPNLIRRVNLRRLIEPVLGADFDAAFLWDNLGRDGREALYCSEFVTKTLAQVMPRPVMPKIMRFDVNREGWRVYFNGNIPDGELGVSPEDFHRSSSFSEKAVFEGGLWSWH